MNLPEIRSKMFRYANDAEILIEEARRTGSLPQSKFDAWETCVKMANMYAQILMAERND